jgi:hypothetical protein
MNGKRLIDLTGQRFGKLVVISRESKYRRNATWRCICDCGKETVVRGDVLDRGTTQSCGCGKGHKHGHFHKPWYPSYKAMMERCYLKSCGNYERYGGKGVTVCEEWHDINKFAEWAETSGYAPGLTIDRIDSTKGYSPENCRWATKKQQSNNRKNTIFYTYKGETKALTDWASILGINRYTLYDRIEKRGWSVEKALETPTGAKMDGERRTDNA